MNKKIKRSAKSVCTASNNVKKKKKSAATEMKS
jgi:hypothetical protein